MLYKVKFMDFIFSDGFKIVFDDIFECLGLWQNGYYNVHYYKDGNVYDTYTFVEKTTRDDNVKMAIKYFENTILKNA